MNLITDAWLPVIRRDGQRERIAPWQIAEAENPIIELDAPRADFQGALYQFLIGLLQTTFAPEDVEVWAKFWEEGLPLDELKVAFASVGNAFELDSPDKPAFLQDYDLAEGEPKSISALLIEAPGGKTLKDNLDHFIKRGRVKCLCPSCTAQALFTLQTNAPSGGVGHRVGLRGGGPLTTLVLPLEADSSLWQKLWLNILDRESLSVAGDVASPAVFPWLGPTRLSDKKGSETTPEDVSPLQMYWGMPRRIRLLQRRENIHCDLCGFDAAYGFDGYRSKNYGTNYDGPWLHPLTPYRFDPKKKNLPLSLKGQQGGLGYRHWLGLTLQDRDNGDTSAKVTEHFRHEKSEEIEELCSTRLWCFGYDMDNMKARCWYEQTFPLLRLDKQQQSQLMESVGDMLRCARLAVYLLKAHVKEAWFNSPGDVKGDMSHVESPFWQDSEADFYRLLYELAEQPAGAPFPSTVFQQWPRLLFKQLMLAFDRWTLEAPPEDLDMKRIVLAREKLKKLFWGNRVIKLMKKRALPAEEVSP
ncbi:type I-E CRISPR-associated protein Cse1/CasA [Motiliproteus sp. MSK22-1]|uniref:type I-E CRISPR-associated protein Cse1/CasA n=1 Tax=Motiliproteus sp. MSK22-1 TaxID=1897630 RepID=UPI000976EF28|nr:type I-E CRISPR-associated protein Cse1/CasA [Motiliproteus sp. MSK22-1]OMH30525.1 type I-E CRISPR-associated protein Cse1/CasA [Motiliproteus sp. MSK22-1]